MIILHAQVLFQHQITRRSAKLDTPHYGKDKHYGKKAYSIVQNLDEIRHEMIENGLVQGGFTIDENPLKLQIG